MHSAIVIYVCIAVVSKGYTCTIVCCMCLVVCSTVCVCSSIITQALIGIVLGNDVMYE
jgi:hypothetical protein